jgi:acid-sensing ion channel, other
MCFPWDLECISTLEKTLVNKDSSTVKSCDCLPECNSIEYEFEVREAKLLQKNGSQNLTAAVSVYFGDDEYIAYRRYANYGTVTFLSNIGGLLGLFLGISVLSIIETISFFTLRFIDDLWYKG